MSNRPRPVVVLTALNLENRLMRAQLTDVKTARHPAGTVFAEGDLAGSPIPVVLGVTGEGNNGAAILVERANSWYDPQALLFVGVAGSLRDDVGLGDVVVATRVYAYHSGKDTDKGFLGRPRSWEASHDLIQLARHIDLTGEWTQWLPAEVRDNPPTVHFAPIAAGETVLTSRGSALARRLHRNFNDAAAVEMEGAGAAQAGHVGSVPVLIIRGISDRADSAKERADAGGSQPAAAAHAAAFATALIRAARPQDADHSPSGSGSSQKTLDGPTSVQQVTAQPGATVFTVMHGNQIFGEAPAKTRMPGQDGLSD